MTQAANDTTAVDKATMRRLGMAILAMCAGAIGLVILAVSVGHFH